MHTNTKFIRRWLTQFLKAIYKYLLFAFKRRSRSHIVTGNVADSIRHERSCLPPVASFVVYNFKIFTFFEAKIFGRSRVVVVKRDKQKLLFRRRMLNFIFYWNIW